MMTAKTNAQKQADRRERLSCGGLFKRRDFWCHPDDESKLRALEKQLQDERKKKHNAKLSGGALAESAGALS